MSPEAASIRARDGELQLLVHPATDEALMVGAVRITGQEAALGGDPSLRTGKGAHLGFVRTLWVLAGLLAAVEAPVTCAARSSLPAARCSHDPLREAEMAPVDVTFALALLLLVVGQRLWATSATDQSHPSDWGQP